MPDIRPFCGILYNPDKIKDLAKVVTEPYDVISPLQQKAYHNSHPYNIIRLALGKQYLGDNSRNNQYTRAKKFFNDWQKRKILLGDEKESIYIYTQTFSHNGKRKMRTGFIVLLKLEDFGKNTILPHENTFSKPVQDRLKILKTVRANLSPIFAIFVDLQGKIDKLLSQYKKAHRPCVVIKKDGSLHRLWRLSEKRKIAVIKKLLKDKQIFIADGHHRYEAALNYKVQMRKKKRLTKASSFNYVMTYLVATADPGLTILPTYRVVKIKAELKAQQILRNLKAAFEVHKFTSSDELFFYMRKNRTAACVFSAYFGKNKFFGLKLKDAKQASDITILHSLIIEPILNIGPVEENIYYTRDAQEAIKLVDEGKYQVVFFLKAPSVMQVQKVAKTGGKMPHKTTYFYPKLLTGLVINKLGESV